MRSLQQSKNPWRSIVLSSPTCLGYVKWTSLLRKSSGWNPSLCFHLVQVPYLAFCRGFILKGCNFQGFAHLINISKKLFREVSELCSELRTKGSLPTGEKISETKISQIMLEAKMFDLVSIFLGVWGTWLLSQGRIPLWFAFLFLVSWGLPAAFHEKHRPYTVSGVLALWVSGCIY